MSRRQRNTTSRQPLAQMPVAPRSTETQAVQSTSNSCLKNWRLVALASAFFGLVAIGGMAWLGRGLVRTMSAYQRDFPSGFSASATTASPRPLRPGQNASEAPSNFSAGDIYHSSPLLPKTWRVVKRWSHDPLAFTQGLVWRGDRLYEGTGMQGRSWLRRVNILGGTWAIEDQVALADQYFGEGIAVWPDRAGKWLAPRADGTPRDVVFQLTWQNYEGFIYDADTLVRLHSFRYSTQGWGITHDNTSLIVSDGSEYLFFWDPVTLAETRRVAVTDADGRAVNRLNELEYIHGWVVANIWLTDYIVFIDPSTGRVGRVLDFGALKASVHNPGSDVLNGIAYTQRRGAEPDAPLSASAWGGRLWLTGKDWDSMFEVEVTSTQPADRRRQR